ncbi:hypothetical protein GE09DRAFT_1135516 [Coniochaeta sp. 2T2.1]|nr:hypothetical protein GE09DRAFT_1135516 [Coniochaeta sp. 2T2.1]
MTTLMSSLLTPMMLSSRAPVAVTRTTSPPDNVSSLHTAENDRASQCLLVGLAGLVGGLKAYAVNIPGGYYLTETGTTPASGQF